MLQSRNRALGHAQEHPVPAVAGAGHSHGRDPHVLSMGVDDVAVEKGACLKGTGVLCCVACSM
jgi:hypothetical protein